MTSQNAAISSVDNCIRSYKKYSSDLDEFFGKCLGISEDLHELGGQDHELANLRTSLQSLVESDITLKQMSDATEICKTAMQQFYQSNTSEDTVPNLVKLYDEELKNIISRSDDSTESHQVLKDFDNVRKPQSRAGQASENVQEPMDSSDIIFSQVEEALYCPITKKYFEDPVRNSLCNHCYSKAAVCEMLARKNSIKCPVGGCTKQVMMPNLIPDKELARRVKRKMKQDKFERQHTAGSAVQL